MPTASILAFHDSQPDLGTSLTTYAETLAEQGFPATHAQLLHELKAWLEAKPRQRVVSVDSMHDILDTEAYFLMDAAVAGVASEHLAFLYTVLGEVFEELGPAFRQATQDEARLAEQTYEEAITEHMRDTGCDRLEAVQYMKGAALERLQERQDRLIYLLQLDMDETP